MSNNNERGIQGEQGIRGPKGEPGKSAGGALKLTDRRLLFLFILSVAVFGYLVWRIQSDAHQRDVYNWNQCQRAHTNTQKINATNRAFQDFLSQFVAASPQPDQLQHFIDIYKNAVLTVPECGSRP